MEINRLSTLADIALGLQGTWDVTNSSDGWTILEQGNLKILKGIFKGKSIALPEKFMQSRTQITPYFKFSKNKVEGGLINLQDTALEINSENENKVIIIIQF